MVEILEYVSLEQFELLRVDLLGVGLELLYDKKSILIKKIRNVIIKIIHYTDEVLKVNFSDFLSEKLGYDCTYL